jgi:uncharacterized membrane protein YhhN
MHPVAAASPAARHERRVATLGIIGLAAAVALAVVDSIAVALDRRPVERIAKPAVIVALALVPISADPLDPLTRLLVLVALGASLVGDVLLLPPGRLMGGLAAFLVAQLAYAAAFLVGPRETAWLLVGVVVAAGFLVGVGRPIVRGAARVGLALPVMVYLGAILAMGVLATGSASPLAAAGAWAFVTSDALLGWGIFASRPGSGADDDRWRRVAVAATYHAAQAMLVLALVA